MYPSPKTPSHKITLIKFIDWKCDLYRFAYETNALAPCIYYLWMKNLFDIIIGIRFVSLIVGITPWNPISMSSEIN